MTKQELGAKLEEMGIKSTNFYPKKSFIYSDVPSIGLFERELQEDFYFHNNFDDKLYVLPREVSKANVFEEDEHEGRTKFVVPLSLCKEIIPKGDDVEEVFVEKEDTPYREMTIRDYFAIKHLKPVSNKKWLNDLIEGK